MSAITIGRRPGAAGHAPAGHRPSLWDRVAAAVANEGRVRRGTRGLLALDDRMLADIGVARDEIEGVVRLGRR